MDILIIGGGAAGLMAAKELSSSNRVTVLEAKEVLGGRIRTDGRIEAGAEFIHGKLPLTLSLLQDAGLTFTAVGGRMFRVGKNKWKQNEEIIEGWDKLLNRMGKIAEDMTLLEFLDTNFPQEKYAKLRNMTVSYAQGFDLADVSKVSTKSLYREWINEDDCNYRVDRGYISLINFLADECRKKQCNIITKSRVKNVSWKNEKVSITTVDDKTYHAEKLIVTTSLGMLQESSVNFTPPLVNYVQAANMLGWGNVIKVILTFTYPFWEDHQKNIGFILSDEAMPTWWTQAPAGSPILTGWLGGPPADKYRNEDLTALALDSLAEIFQRDITVLKTMLVSAHCFDWSDNPEVGGAYSYDTPLSEQARRVLNSPVLNTIYFAGEALYSGKHPGTVEAALISGRDVAIKILRYPAEAASLFFLLAFMCA